MAESADEELLQALRLNLVSGIGPRLQQTLRVAFDSPADIFSATDAQLRQLPGIGPKLIGNLRKVSLADAEAERERCVQANVQLIPQSDPAYPSSLFEICDAPGVLYCRGTIESSDHLAIGIVGSRHCTLYGQQQTESLSTALSHAGFTIVSGMARGIDAVAHRAALAAGARTFAIAATGMHTVYPPEHSHLADEIAAQGAILTECNFRQKPVAGLFPQRNRIISGLSLGVIIIEAHRKSGALHTARHAMEQGREVFVVPGRLDSTASEGCHDLIHDGATLIRGADDVIEALGPLQEPLSVSETETIHTPRELNLNPQETEVLNLLSSEPTHIDEVMRNLELDDSRILATITVLEMRRLVQRLPGGYLVRGSF